MGDIMCKINKKAFFLIETMVVITVVGVVITLLFGRFSNLYNRFLSSEYYNTVSATNAASHVRVYIDDLNIDYNVIMGDSPYVNLTFHSSLHNDYYTVLKENLGIKFVYLINVQSFFEDSNNLLDFNINLRGYLNTLENEKAQFLIVVVDEDDSYGFVSAFNYYLFLEGNAADEYVTYVELNQNFIEPGYEAKDNNGNDLDVTVTGFVDTSQRGTYYLNYNVGALLLRRRIVVYQKEYLFDYTGTYQVFTAPFDGHYNIELWGAGFSHNRGKGGYTSGDIFLFKNQRLYLYLGGTNTSANTESFNGGFGSNGGGPGAGATDVRLVPGEWKNIESLRSRIMVAAGGGAGNVEGAHGGGLIGLAAGTATGGTQTAPGTTQSSSYLQASFGIGGSGCGGGGGYYGGGGASCASGGAGGSSFISGFTGCNAIAKNGEHTDQSIHYSGYKFTNIQMISGNSSMPNPRGDGNIVGNNSDGFARITLLDTSGTHNLQGVRYIYNQIQGSTSNSGNHWVELKAIDTGGENVALGVTKINSSNMTVNWNGLTDGVVTTTPYISTGSGLQWVEIDLGREYDLSSIRIWHYYGDGRTYFNLETRVAGTDEVYRVVDTGDYMQTPDGRIIRPN